MKRILAGVAALVAVGWVMSSPSALSAQILSTNESFSSCTPTLCIDAPPEGPKGLDGSGGWGWNSKANAPVSVLTVGTAATFTVTVMQPNTVSPPLCGSGATLTITLTYSSQDFSLSATDSRGTTGTNPFDRGGVESFSYTGDFLCHTDQSTAFTFTPMNPTNTALVTVTVNVMEPGLQTSLQQASETFPVSIVPAPKTHK